MTAPRLAHAVRYLSARDMMRAEAPPWWGLVLLGVLGAAGVRVRVPACGASTAEILRPVDDECEPCPACAALDLPPRRVRALPRP